MAAVRRMHPHRLPWRAFRRAAVAIFVLSAQLKLLIGAGAAVVGLCIESERWSRGDMIATREEEILFGIIALGVTPIALGTWLSCGFGHLGRIRAWSIFMVLVACVIVLGFLGESLARGSSTGGWVELAGRLVMLAVIMAVATAGIPLGMLVGAGWRRWRRNRWRARRRRIRSRRHGQ